LVLIMIGIDTVGIENLAIADGDSH